MESFIDIEPGKVLKIFSQAETFAIEKKWMDIYCKNKQGFNTKAFKWHIFSGGGYPSLESNDAQKEYELHIAAKYIVMSNDRGLAFLTDIRPTNCNQIDVYVFPENMSWTMAFTHEEGWLGPYFAKHKSYKQLEKENDKFKDKRKQIEIAKRKGWV